MAISANIFRSNTIFVRFNPQISLEQVKSGSISLVAVFIVWIHCRLKFRGRNFLPMYAFCKLFSTRGMVILKQFLARPQNPLASLKYFFFANPAIQIHTSTQLIRIYNFIIIGMGPKKKPQPGAQDNAQKVEFLTNKVKSLEQKIAWQQERADRAKILEDEHRKQIVELDSQFTKEKEELFQISNKMSEQYDKKQEELKGKVTEKRVQLAEKEDEIAKSKQTLKTCQEEYEEKLKDKEKQLTELKQKMEDMSIEFSRMLRETLEKMQERIELQQWDNESDPQLIKKMKDLSQLYSS